MPNHFACTEIATGEDLLAYLRDELDWRIETEDVDDATFEYDATEFGLDAKHSAVEIGARTARPRVERRLADEPSALRFYALAARRAFDLVGEFADGG